MADGLRGDEALHAAEEIGREHQIVRRSGRAHGREVPGPVEGRRQRLDLSQGHLVVEILGVAPRDDLHGALGQARFQGEHGLRVGRSLSRCLAAHLQHPGDVLPVQGTNLLGLVVLVQIELAPRQVHPRLVERRDVDAGVVEIGGGEDPEQDARVLRVDEVEVRGPDRLMNGGDQLGKAGRVTQAGDAVELRLQGREARLVDGRFVHARGVVVARLLLHRRALLLRGGLLEGARGAPPRSRPRA